MARLSDEVRSWGRTIANGSSWFLKLLHLLQQRVVRLAVVPKNSTEYFIDWLLDLTCLVELNH
jgi:hypothetical protein